MCNLGFNQAVFATRFFLWTLKIRQFPPENAAMIQFGSQPLRLRGEFVARGTKRGNFVLAMLERTAGLYVSLGGQVSVELAAASFPGSICAAAVVYTLPHFFASDCTCYRRSSHANAHAGVRGNRASPDTLTARTERSCFRYRSASASSASPSAA